MDDWTKRLFADRKDKEQPWHDQYHRAKNGAPLRTLRNILIALRNDPLLSDCFGYDEMTNRAMLVRNLPGQDTLPERIRLEDHHCALVQEFLQEFEFYAVGYELVFQAVNMRARECPYHPVIDYLYQEIVWDKIGRVHKLFRTYFGATEQPRDYLELVGRMFLISMIARVRQPGCQCDYLVVLEGKQGSRKSLACKLLGEPWFSRHLPDITQGKQASEHLEGKWLIEIAELSSIYKAHPDALKAFITRETEQFRKPYARIEIDMPRQCVFIATTNDSEYLRDPTGGRRFWPVKCGEIDVEALERDRDQIMAEAVAYYEAGNDWWPNEDFEERFMASEQKAREIEDPWCDLLRKVWHEVPTSFGTYDAMKAIGMEGARDMNPREASRMAKALRQLGCEYKNDSKRRFWIKPDATNTSDTERSAWKNSNDDSLL